MLVASQRSLNSNLIKNDLEPPWTPAFSGGCFFNQEGLTRTTD